MFIVKEDASIYLTRGDAAVIAVSANDGDGGTYKFQDGDRVIFRVFEKKNCQKVLLQKELYITSETETAEILLTSNDTKIGDVISKPKDYWYEVELNPQSSPQTIVGYDEDGAKIFRLFPEGSDK